MATKYVRPARRPLKIYAFDPMRPRATGNKTTMTVANEELEPGPRGARVHVIDYDIERNLYYPPVDLNDPAVLMQGGLDPSESDPRFHQQMVYAISMKVIENVERALGRRFRFRAPLRIFPHAFVGENAFYDRDLGAILFGYFRADRNDPGPNLPGQVVFTCLSHDIITHEMTHAVVDRLRPYFLEASNPDVLAFHEGFSDIVAIFQHFTFSEALRDEIARIRGDLGLPSRLAELAGQFGYATGSGGALRQAIDQPDPKAYMNVMEPHDRGSILVAAVFEGFLRTYEARTRDLVRLATDGTGRLPEGDLHPDLVGRLLGEATRTAQAVLTMCLRAFDYLPPVDVTFGDFLRALVTADFALNPTDPSGLRDSMISAFRGRGIYPTGVTSLSEESLLWEEPPDLEPLPEQDLGSVLQIEAGALTARRRKGQDEDASIDKRFGALHKYGKRNAAALRLGEGTMAVRGFHPVFRVRQDGLPTVEFVVQFVQTDKLQELGGLPFRSGTTLVADAEGIIRRAIYKSPEGESLGGLPRLEAQKAFMTALDARDPNTPWMNEQEFAKRMVLRSSVAALHRRLES